MPSMALAVATYTVCVLAGSMTTVLMPRVDVKSIGVGDTAVSVIIVGMRVQLSPPFVERYRPVPAPELFG